MARYKIRLNLENMILLGTLLLTSLLVTPWHNFDAINPPKLGSLIFCSSIGSILLIQRSKKLLDQCETKGFVFLVMALISWMTLSIIFNRYSLSERLFGVFGRNTGFLTYASLCIILVLAISPKNLTIKQVNSTLLLISALVSIYYLIQLFEVDAAEWNIVYEQSPSSTLGNPNFVSALVSIGFAVALGRLIESARNKRLASSIFYSFFCVSSLWIVSRTNSTQGLIIAAFALFFYVATWFWFDLLPNVKVTHLFILKGSFIILSTGGILLAFSVLRDEILQGVLNARIDYWMAGLNMTYRSPFFGVGFDSFGDYYLRSKPQDALFVSDSAHNLWIEISSYAGIPALMLFLTIQVMVLSKVRKVIATQNNAELRFALLAWLGFHIQSLVSPSSIALLVVGFFFTGFLYGQSTIFNKEAHKIAQISTRTDISRYVSLAKLRNFSVTAFLVCWSIVGLSMAFLPLIKDARFRDAIERGDGSGMINQTLAWPFSSQIALVTAKTLNDNNYQTLAISTLEKAVKSNPENSELWATLLAMETSEFSKNLARERLQSLDPQNPTYNRE